MIGFVFASLPETVGPFSKPTPSLAASSTLHYHLTLKVSFRKLNFGAESDKPTTLFSNAPWIHKIQEYALPPGARTSNPSRLANLAADVDGVLRPRGDAKLKASSSYPVAFGRALADLFAANRSAWRHSVASRCNPKVCKCRECPTLEALLTTPPAAGDDLLSDANFMPLLTSVRGQALRIVPHAFVDQVIELD